MVTTRKALSRPDAAFTQAGMTLCFAAQQRPVVSIWVHKTTAAGCLA